MDINTTIQLFDKYLRINDAFTKDVLNGILKYIKEDIKIELFQKYQNIPEVAQFIFERLSPQTKAKLREAQARREAQQQFESKSERRAGAGAGSPRRDRIDDATLQRIREAERACDPDNIRKSDCSTYGNIFRKNAVKCASDRFNYLNKPETVAEYRHITAVYQNFLDENQKKRRECGHN